MSQRIDRSWIVLASVEDDDNKCVDFFSRPDGTFGFEEFRRDMEDVGRWTPARYFSGAVYASPIQAVSAAERAVPWLTEVLTQKAYLRSRITAYAS